MAALEAHPAFKAATTILIYHSLPDEVSTHAFIEKWQKTKRLLLPVVVGNDLEIRLYSGLDNLATGSYGISEPTGCRYSEYKNIELVIVPGVAFDLNGNRLGRGKGYYDRLLPQLSHSYKIGICFPYQIVKEVPAEPFDIRMDEILTI